MNTSVFSLTSCHSSNCSTSPLACSHKLLPQDRLGQLEAPVGGLSLFAALSPGHQGGLLVDAGGLGRCEQQQTLAESVPNGDQQRERGQEQPGGRL